MMSKPLKTFIVYSHQDIEAKEKLILLLSVMTSEGLINIWSDNQIHPGDKWQEVVFDNIADSDILLYLVSTSSLTSKSCYMELVRSLNTSKKVIPIILEHCDWPNHQLSDFQVLPDKGIPIRAWQPESSGWQNVIDGIRRTIITIQNQMSMSTQVFQEGIQAEQAFQRGHVLMMLGETNKAIEAYSMAFQLNPQHASAYVNSIFSNIIKMKEQDFSGTDKPVVLTEGFLDAHYIQTALILLEEVDLLNALKIEPVGIKDGKGTRSGGQKGLNNFLNIYHANSSLFRSPILLLYDCDTQQQGKDLERLWVRVIPENLENTKVKKGIENLFPENLFQESSYQKYPTDDGGYAKHLDKDKFCKWICEERKNPEDFENFNGIVEILRKFRHAHKTR